MFKGGFLNEQQLPISRAEIIRASAGSGKTFVLVQRYLALLLHGESASSILASTFTVRAAGEIRERVITRLASAVLSDKVRQELEAEYQQSISAERISQVLARAINELPGSAICTLDALVARIAGSLTLDCDLPLGWRMSELPGLSRELERELVALQAAQLGKLIAMIVRSDASRRIAQPLIDACQRFHEQLQIYGPAAFEFGPLEVISEPISKWAERLQRLTLPVTKNHIPRVVFAAAIEKLKTALNAGEATGLFSETIIQRALERTSYDREDLSSVQYAALWELAERLRVFEKNRIIERQQVLLMVLANFDELYRQHQSQTGLVKHSDLLLAVARFMAKDELSGVAYALDQRFSHVLLDEFQDTSPLQWAVLKPFIADVVSDAARSRTAFIVGDPKQAIYGWRGGSAAIFDEVTEALPGAWEERSLAESYRSSATILQVVNRVFLGLTMPEGGYAEVKERFQKNFKPHVAKRSIIGRVTISLGEESPSAWVVTKLQEIFASNPEAEIGILVRKNDTVVQIVRELRHAGLPAQGDGRAGSERTLPVEAIKKLLHYSLHPADSSARYLVEMSGLLEAEEKIETVAPTVTHPAFIARLVRLCSSGKLNAEQRRDLRLAINTLSTALERGANARELHVALQTQPLPGGRGQVSVMTMHRAKGLEFEYVLLPELDQKLIRNVAPDALTWQEPDGSYRVIPYVNEALQGVDSRLRSADLQMREAEMYEALCLLYVALTRATTELHLFTAVSTKAKRGPGVASENTKYAASMAGVVCGSLSLSLATPGVIFDTNAAV